MTAGAEAAYAPPRWLPGGHLQTIVPSLWPGPSVGDPVESLVVDVGEGSAVRVDLVRPRKSSRGTLLLVHGLAGDARSSYMVRTAIHAVSRGWAVAMMNLRNCGGTESLARTLDNAGQSGDADAVLAALEREAMPRPHVAAGFSLGGNLLLLYAARAGVACRADAVAGVNAPIDLEACLGELERPGNALYEAHFVLKLCSQIRHLRTVRAIPGPPAVWRTIRRLRRFDEVFTAPDAGHASAEAYYAAASAAPWLGGLRAPTLLLSAANDPFVPVRVFEAVRGVVPAVVVRAHPRQGGHVGYWQSRGERFWAATALLDFFEGARGGAARPTIS